MICKDINILKKVSEPATDEEARQIIPLLEKELLLHDNGIGLSAIQIGIPKRIFVICVKGKESSFMMNFINPEIQDYDGEFIFKNEGCLSFPGLFCNTKRYRDFVIKRRFLDGVISEERNCFYYSEDKEDLNSDGIIAIAVQHEMDHLNGLILPEYKIVDRRIGRNDLCFCGSGKKYKKCCLKT